MKAIAIVHWPGSDVPACQEHRDKLIRLGESMGFRVSSSPLLDEELECTNCANKEVR